MSENTERTTAALGPAIPPGPAGGPAVHRTHRQRRPTGAPPPLPHPIAISTTAWLLVAVIIVAGAFLFSELTPWLRVGDRASTRFLTVLADVRTPWLTDVAGAIKAAGSGWGATAVGLSVVVLTMVFRRWRHLLVFMGSIIFLEIVGQWIYNGLSRPRPYGVTIISSWGGYSAPSPPVATLTIFLMGALYCLVVPGRPRTYAKAVVALVIAVFCLARLYLAVDHPTTFSSASRSGSRSRSPRSATSPRTWCSPSSTAGARPLTWTSPAGEGRRSGRPSMTSSG